MLIYQCICLVITFYILQYYISAGVHARTHRLLPMLLTTIALYNFYEIVKCLTGDWKTIKFLEILLALQMIYVVFFYVLDFLRIKLPVYLMGIFFVLLFGVDVIIFRTYPNKIYLKFYYGFSITFILFLFVLSTYAFFRYSISRKEYQTTIPSYISLLLPGIALILSKAGIFNQDIVVPASFELSGLMLLYMMKKDLLSDTETILLENLYTTSNNAYVLFDQYFYYINCNAITRELFPEKIAEIESRKRSERYAPKLKEILENEGEVLEYDYGEKHYVCRVRAIKHKNAVIGYILALVDITHQKNELYLMEELKKSAEEISHKKSQIMLQTSHDLRSPLHTIIGTSDILMQRRILDSDNTSLVQQIKNAGKNLLVLVNDMLEFTKMETGDITLESSSGFLHPYAESVSDMLSTEKADPSWTYPEAKALIADDMKLNLYIFKELIAPWKLQIDTVADGMAAIEAVKKEKYDIIFLDRLMPGKDGLETCVELKQMTKAPIILLSANMSEYDLAEYEPYGFNDYMGKPFSVRRLKTVLERNLSRNLRVKADNVAEEASSANVSRLVLASYKDELGEVNEGFSKWLQEDISLFRTKVHGIKGISRQVGYEELGEISEVMEMAAKANHVDFIARHAKEYLEQINDVMNRVSIQLEVRNDENPGEGESEADLEDLFDNF